MIGNLIVAGFAGALIPIALEKLGVDPALASGTFVTTTTDVFGFFAFLGLASADAGLNGPARPKCGAHTCAPRYTVDIEGHFVSCLLNRKER